LGGGGGLHLMIKFFKDRNAVADAQGD
jgi:hypothetical protein